MRALPLLLLALLLPLIGCEGKTRDRYLPSAPDTVFVPDTCEAEEDDD